MRFDRPAEKAFRDLRPLGAILATRLPYALLACVLVTVPLLGVSIVPFTDLPRHMGRFAVVAHGRDPVFPRLMAYRWYPIPNLGTDIIVAAPQPVPGITRATWPTACGGAGRRRPTMQETLAPGPLDAVDFLWRLDARLPPGTRPRLAERWRAGGSTLYAIVPKAATANGAARQHMARNTP